jgi:uncharacterized membrane protein YhaH (DUF805 family)
MLLFLCIEVIIAPRTNRLLIPIPKRFKLSLINKEMYKMNEYLGVIKKYAVFGGRASRREYWMFVLINILISLVLSIVGAVIFSKGSESGGGTAAGNALGNLYSLAIFLPSLAVQIRRMHDTNHSGWFSLIPIYCFILAVTAGDKMDNRFGADPYGAGMGAAPAYAGAAPMPMQPMSAPVVPGTPVQPVSPVMPVDQAPQNPTI